MRTPAFVAALTLICGTAAAQNKLDKPLDRNLQRNSGGRNPAGASFRDELRFRNAIVTGNAVGGLSFRGNVGYVAPGEFFGNLPTNDSFAFRRDSFYSGLGGMGIRGTDALQYQIAMTTGNTPPPGFGGIPILQRENVSSGATLQARISNAIGENGVPRPSTERHDLAGDLRNMSLLSIRSPAAFVATRTLEPTVVGRIPGADGGTVGVSASPLRGLTFDTSGLKPQAPGVQGVPAKLPKVDPTPARPGAAGERLTEDPRTSSSAPNKADTKLDTSAPPPPPSTPYDQLMERIRGGETPEEPGKEPAAGQSAWQTQIDELRTQLGATKRVRPGEARRDDKKPEKPDAKPADPGQPGEPKPDVKPEVMPGETGKGELRPETIERIRKAGGKVENLAPPGFDAYSTHMKAAQDHIAAGRFFFAEERFTAALSTKPGDPMAAIGRIHSQLGAGMFLSAEINLRVLFTEHPEVVSLKYKAELLPSPERIKTLIERLDELTGAKDGKRRETGFLLAYVGYQGGDEKAMKRGLDIMVEAPEVPEGEKAPEGPDQISKLGTLLSKIWLAPAPAVAPAVPAPAPPAAPPETPK